MPDLMFVCVFLIVWVSLSCAAREVFRRDRGLMLAGICTAPLAAFCFASFAASSVQAVGEVSDSYGALQLAQLAMFYVFVAGMLAVIGVFMFFAIARAVRAILLRTKIWRVRACMKKAKKCADKAKRLIELGISSDRVGTLLEQAKGYSDEAKWLMDKMQGIEGPKPQREERKEAGRAKRRLKKKAVGGKKDGYVEWKNEGV